MRTLIRPLGTLVTCLVATLATAQSFYDARFLSGVTDFNRGAYARAVDELRVAAFGRVDDVSAYETAEIYLTLACDKLDHAEDAKAAALKVIQAERLSPVYSTISLPAEIRTAFEAALPKLLTREQLSHAPAFTSAASQAPIVQSGEPRLSSKPQPPVPTPTKEPNVAVTVKKNEQRVEAPQPEDYGRLALERVAAGDEAGGTRYAGLALANNDTNVNAHTALAQIAYAHRAWNDVAEHYAIVRTLRRLTDDESAAYFIALVKTSRNSDAIGVRRGLPSSVLSRADVHEASDVLDGRTAVHRTTQDPAPQPAAPQPVAPQPVAPQPVAPQPAAPRTPAPQTAAPQTPAPQTPAPQTPAPQTPAPQPNAQAGTRTEPKVQPEARPPQPVRPATQPAASQQPSSASSATAAAPLSPPPAPTGDKPPVSMQIAAAEQLLRQNDVVGARGELRRIAALPSLDRSERLALGRAMSQSALYAESSAQYRKAYPLKAGEEAHMFYEAVNRYQLGDYDLARQLMTRAMPSLPQTPAILAYRDRILGQH